MELYIHIPFCVRKCNYCDFLSYPIAEKKEIVGKYIDALCRELWSFSRLPSYSTNENKASKIYEISGTIEQSNYKKIKLDTIYIGGGTPSILEIDEIEKVLKTVKDIFVFDDNIEYSIECNPGTLTFDKLKLYKKYGVNRISLGLQSDNNKHLLELGRIHTYGRFLESYCMARRAGFDNINIDLISAIPGQTKAEWENTLHSICSLEPEHISAYSLIIEEGTPLYETFEQNPDILKLPSEDDEREMYHITKRILEEHGYLRYEISNYAKISRLSRHNFGYWTGEEYYGAGLGASSYLSRDNYLKLVNRDDVYKYKVYKENVNNSTNNSTNNNTNNNTTNNNVSCDISRNVFIALNNSDRDIDSVDSMVDESIADENILKVRFKNSSDFETYISGRYENVELLTQEDCISEFCILRLRTVQGISKEEFENLFGISFDEKFGDVVRKYKSLKLLEENGTHVFFTEDGFDVSNTILVDFMN